jgi:hypothetical protein
MAERSGDVPTLRAPARRVRSSADPDVRKVRRQAAVWAPNEHVIATSGVGDEGRHLYGDVCGEGTRLHFRRR